MAWLAPTLHMAAWWVTVWGVEEVASESPGELSTLDSPTPGMYPVSLPRHHKLIRISWGGQLGTGELDKLLQ